MSYNNPGNPAEMDSCNPVTVMSFSRGTTRLAPLPQTMPEISQPMLSEIYNAKLHPDQQKGLD